ncbi:glutathione S-transferase T3-like [Zingiber officinale]|uniref:glutathione S-transferase T3-like n=1 Tax=Zingiber officinale TaxID=94328 RepID=UPI001C4B29C8|nr:glutathione S-transferase T3-like [Zingiber officinale]
MGSQLGMSYPYGVSPNQPPVILSNESRRATIDPSISDKESLTPSSVPATQVPPHSSQEEREVELEENESKRRFWSPDEDVVLAKSWATISTDAIIGNDQKDQAFWKRIGDYYNKHRPTGSMMRSYQPLKSHYYRVLKDYEKYTPQSVAHYSNKKVRTSESGGNTSTSNPDTSVDLDDSEVRIRPIGQKAAKMKGKSKAREGDTMEHNIDKEWQDIKEYQMQKMTLRETEIFHKDYEILMKDTSEMIPGQLYLHEKMVEKIKQRHGLV